MAKIIYAIRQFDLDITYNPDSKWQVIYMLNGLDYCRESYPASMDILKLQDTILSAIAAHNLTCARVEYF